MSYNKPEKDFGEAPKVHKIRPYPPFWLPSFEPNT